MWVFFVTAFGRFTKTKMCNWQGGNLGILLRVSEDWKTMCWYKTNNRVFKGVRQGMNEYSSRLANLKVGMLWFQLISCGHVKIHLGAYIHEMQYFTCLNRLFLQKNAFSCYHFGVDESLPSSRIKRQTADSLKSLKWRPQRWKPCSLVASCQARRLVREWAG